VAYYAPEQDVISETAELFADDDGEEDERGPNEKPFRTLTDFTFFDPTRNNEVVLLSVLEEDYNQHIEAVGSVSACLQNDEDEGQEDDIDVPENESHLRLRLATISRICVDLTLQDKWVRSSFIHSYLMP
jgi:hypothetical protein